jgi:hypothetical protein
MHTGEISFCCHIGFNLKSDDVKKSILAELSDKYNYKIINKHFEKYHDDKLTVLRSRPHLISLRTNGNPYFLYLTQINGVNQCIFIDKKVQNGYVYPRMVIVKFFFNDALFENRTLFDGEMVKTRSEDWIFILNDILVDNGVSCNVNIMKRVSRIYEILCCSLIVTSQDICAFQVKKYCEYEEIEMMLNVFQETLPYTCRGLYFTPLFLKHRPILMNFDDTLIKKRVQEKKDSTTFMASLNTEDFKTIDINKVLCVPTQIDIPVTTMRRTLYLRKTHIVDVYEVFDDKGNDMDIAFVNSMKSSKALREAFLNTTPVDKLSFVCEYNEKFNKWHPLLS